MKFLELKIPPALLMLLFGFLMWLTAQALPQLKVTWPWHEWVARAVFVLAFVLIAAGAYSFRKASTTVDPTRPEKATSVVSNGIYRVSRNPMYLGFLLMLLAFMFKLANPVTALLLPVFVVYMNQFQIKPEERALLRLFGKSYAAYQNQVRRWI
ncbi:isoprenylcysteine carboxylmethyltransferase family protein [Marinicella sp. S1101]|uniref:methyltransferase family protein n=1 Tax=Marinicella marina TaxID=2996016 RepID=UPI00226083BE|nr:isoprenylcysteine carboxylmethyltransferase family protein [Marinicella marina]MCX7553204.1 isoprenylcysteine carboxylmethyltransferase family protein [Marinicella marina]MDJ1138936.1 isoprenylcysteine carboxylmethyltransferase family protein [Marinicella marina]